MNENKIYPLTSYALGIFSCFLRAFLDTIEKYLFEFHYLNPYKILMIEGIIGFLLLPILFLSNTTYEDINEFIGKSSSKFILLIIFLIIYFILRFFKNIYKVLTIRNFSPMTRALSESILDPFGCIYKVIINNKYNNLYYIPIIICLFSISFLSLVINDFIVLYCCGLEYYTHFEIQKRAYFFESESVLIYDVNKPIEKKKNHRISELLKINN